MPITVNNKASNIPGYNRQVEHLLGLNLLEARLLPSDLISFIDYEQLFSGQILKINSPSIFQKLLKNKLKIVLVCLRQELGLSFLYIVKKCLFLHMFIHMSAGRGFLTQEVSEQINIYLHQILQQDIPAVIRVRQPEKRGTNHKKTNSLSKLYNAIRTLSGSKKEEKISKSKLKIEGTDQKGAIKEIIDKVIAPFACYMLKINQDTSNYSMVLSRKIPQQLWQAFKWKLHNYLSHLGKIVVELNRLIKYYKEELLGTWVLLNYCMSTDIYIYYDLLTDDLSARSERWKDRLFGFSKYSKIDKKKYIEQLLGNPKLLELKEEIDLVMSLKQRLIYIYYNAALSNWTYLMRKPQNISQNTNKMQAVNWILDFYDQYAEKISNKLGKSGRKGSQGDLSRNKAKSQHINPIEPGESKINMPPKPQNFFKQKNDEIFSTAISLIPSDRNANSTQSSAFLSVVVVKNKALGY